MTVFYYIYYLLLVEQTHFNVKKTPQYDRKTEQDRQEDKGHLPIGLLLLLDPWPNVVQVSKVAYFFLLSDE
jgi:hypothetical protein